jgi:hypothetical protein
LIKPETGSIFHSEADEMTDEKDKLVLFEGRKIRRIWYNNEWYFSVIDVVEVLTDSPSPSKYWYQVKEREFKELQLSPIWRQLKLSSSDGKSYATDCANTRNMLRVIQSIPSKKAEPFKQWLAKVGYERIQEIEDPELAQERMKRIYEQKGYSREWVEKRLRGIAIRQELTDEWKQRNIEENREYAILTNEISKATFDKTVEEYKKHKDLKNENLRDHMGDLELIFTMLGEKMTTEITKNYNAQGLDQNKITAKKGGGVAGRARKDAEAELGRSVVSEENYLTESESVKRKRLKS